MIAKYSIVLIAAVMLGCSSGFSQARKDPTRENVGKEIRRLEQERLNAYIRLDARTLDRLLSASYSSIYADGHIVTKAEELASIKSAPGGALSTITATIDQVSVSQFPNSAVLIARLTVKGKIDWPQKPISVNASFAIRPFTLEMHVAGK
jgi:hypothetical protein